MSIVSDVQAYLAAETLVDGSTGWPSVRRRVHDNAGDRLVIITEDGGSSPDLSADDGLGAAALRDPGVQIRVRAAAWDGDAAEAKAADIFAALHSQFGIMIGSTYYDRVRALSEPVFIGFDDESRPEFTTSYRFASFVGAAL